MMTGGKIRKSDKNDENSVILQNFYSIPFNNPKKISSFTIGTLFNSTNKKYSINDFHHAL